jgi:hypothetical protein
MNHAAPRDGKYSLAERLDSYFVNHYIGLHSTIVSVAMAVAGLAAASLLGTSKIYHGDYALLWLLWLTSVLCCAIVYMGVLSSVIVVPASIPSAFDLLIPLFLGINEFLLFGVLAHQATGLIRTSAVVHYWFISFAFFCLFSVAGIVRADRLSARGLLSEGSEDMRKLHRLLIRDASGAGLLGVIGVAGSIVTNNGRISPLSYVLVAVLLAGLSGGLLGHAKTARLIEDVIHS